MPLRTALVVLLTATLLSADEPKTPQARSTKLEPVRKELVKPKDWPAGHPLPLVGSNCAACHLTAGRELTAAVVNHNDQLWNTLRKVHKKNIAKTENPVPADYRKEVDSLRAATMRIIHKAKEVSAQDATRLNARAEKLRSDLEKWLQSGQ